MRKAFPLVSSDMLHLLVRKGTYPYTYMDSFEKYKETQLPPKHVFYNDLTESHISSEDYDHAKDVWSTFKCKKHG